MTQFVDHTELKSSGKFAEDQHNQVNRIINNVKLQQVETTDQFQSTLQAIKEKVLMKPVIFEKPSINDHVYCEKNGRRVYTIDVEIRFTGSIELFNYTLISSYPVYSSGKVYQPTENSILIQIDYLQIPEKEKVLSNVNEQMKLTYEIIEGNNASIKDMNLSFAPIIENKLKEYKTKLEGLYVK
jgi:hypothetical protein